MAEESPQVQKNEAKQPPTQFRVLGLALELGFTIAIPIVFLAFLGRFLDREFETSPWFLLGGVFVSIVVSTAVIYRKMSKMLT